MAKDDDDEKDPNAVALGRKGGLKGGAARLAALSPQRRTEIARAAAEAKWGKDLPRATHRGTLTIGKVKIPCAVLENGRRVITENGITIALLGSRSGASKRLKKSGAPLPLFLAPGNISSFISQDLIDGPLKQLRYVDRNRIIDGYDATLLPAACEVWLTARDAGALQAQQLAKAKQADILMRGLARVGIIALVDEATGYQADRAKNELQIILDAYIVEEMRPWIRMFPTEFFRQVYRLMNWEFKEGTAKRTPYIGKLINEWIYGRLPPGVLVKLREVNPAVNGRRRHKHHQFLTEETGVPHLDRQVAVVTALARASTDRPMFDKLLTDACPRPGDQTVLPLPNPNDE